MDVTCRRCFAVIPAADIDPSLGFVECRRCNAIFELRPDGEAPAPKAEVPMPRGVRVQRHGEGSAGDPYRSAGPGKAALEVSLPFTRWRGLIGAAGGVFLLGLGVFLAVEPRIRVQVPIGVLVFVGLAGLSLLWPGLAYLVNRRRIVIDAEAIDIRNGPIPWPGRRRIAVGELKQLYVERIVYRGNRGSDERYVVCTIDADGVHGTLITLDRAAQALWLEQAIEQQLGITDVPVLPKPV